MKKYLVILLLVFLVAACGPVAAVPVTPTAIMAPTFTPIPALTFTPIPTLTAAAPTPTFVSDPPNTITMDFIALLCNAKWSNGAQHLSACPPSNVDRSSGYAMGVDPLAVGLPAGTAALLTVPAWNGNSSLFLRYPSYNVHAGDRFRTSVLCRVALPCDVQFALEYYDAHGKYQPLFAWNQVSGQAPTVIDADLSILANQNVELVLVLRLFHALYTDQQDNGIWIAPHIYRAGGI